MEMVSMAGQPGMRDYASLDPNAGGIYRDKPIWDLPQIDNNLNRTGYDWYHNNYGELDDGVLNYGFWLNYQELANSYYVNATGSISFNEAYYADNFSPFTAGQMGLARAATGLWDDLIGISLRETKSGNADITYGNTDTGGAQAYAYLPFGSVIDSFYKQNYDFDEAGRLGGDVWIDGFVGSNFFPLADSYYAKTTMIHETGHSLGLSHPGNYNAIGPDGQVLSPTYVNQAEYAQDSLQYSIMSYFDGYETGAQYIDFSLLNFAYPATPQVHDIAAIQAIYGVDTTTRTGDTVYGFNATADRAEYDFTLNTRPVVTIWDAGGRDTLDFSGFRTPTVMNLNEGSFSSGGGIEQFLTLEQVNANRAELGFAPRSQAAFDYYEGLKAQFGLTNGLFKDNIAIAYGATIENAIGGSGNDMIIANQVANNIRGGRGNDTVSYETATSGVIVSLVDGVDGRGGAQGDHLRQIENLIGSNFRDRLIGSVEANVLDGGLGNDILTGGRGSDTFVFHTEAASGIDRVTDFSIDDYIATDRAINDPDGDGVIQPGSNGRIVLDDRDGDMLILQGPAAAAGLKYVGIFNSMYVYASANNSAPDPQALQFTPHATDLTPASIAHDRVAPTATELALRNETNSDAVAQRPGTNSNPFGFEHANSPTEDGALAQSAGYAPARASGAALSHAFGADTVPLDAMIGAHGGAQHSVIEHVMLY